MLSIFPYPRHLTKRGRREVPWGLVVLLVSVALWGLLAFSFGLAFGLGRELASAWLVVAL